MPTQFNPTDIPGIITRIYQQVLERQPDQGGETYYSSKLNLGEMTVRDIVKELGLSQEHRDRFLTPNTDTDAVNVCYKHFLAREPEAQRLQYSTHQAEAQAGRPS